MCIECHRAHFLFQYPRNTTTNIVRHAAQPFLSSTLARPIIHQGLSFQLPFGIRPSTIVLTEPAEGVLHSLTNKQTNKKKKKDEEAKSSSPPPRSLENTRPPMNSSRVQRSSGGSPLLLCHRYLRPSPAARPCRRYRTPNRR